MLYKLESLQEIRITIFWAEHTSKLLHVCIRLDALGERSPKLIVANLSMLVLKLEKFTGALSREFEQIFFKTSVLRSRETIWKNVKKFSKVGQVYKLLVSLFAHFLNTITKV